jgi:hypothetical protein
MENNLELYEKVKVVPETAKKPIQAGNLKGYTDINPMWRIKVLTEQFGICGIGWYTEIIEQWKEQGAGPEIIFFVKLNLYIKFNNEWTKPIQGTGGSMLINNFSKGAKSNDEALKMAETDAISVACKKLGIGADVYFEKDRTKYNNIEDDHKEDNKSQTLYNILNNAEKGKIGTKEELLKAATFFKNFGGYTDILKVSDNVADNLLKKISDEQIARMMAIAGSKGVTDEQLKTFISKVWGKLSKKDLNNLEYRILCGYLDKKDEVKK